MQVEQICGTEDISVVVATDGSAGVAGVGWGWWRSPTLWGGGKLPDSYTCFAAELVAVIESLRSCPVGSRVLVLSDNQSVVHLVNQCLVSSITCLKSWSLLRHSLVAVIGKCDKVLAKWVKGHAGIAPNLHADWISVAAALVTLPGVRPAVEVEQPVYIEVDKGGEILFKTSAASQVKEQVTSKILNDLQGSSRGWWKIGPDESNWVEKKLLSNSGLTFQEQIFMRSLRMGRVGFGEDRVMQLARQGGKQVPIRSCPVCGQGPDSVEHWLAVCSHPALRVGRAKVLVRYKRLSVLSTGLDAVVIRLQGLGVGEVTKEEVWRRRLAGVTLKDEVEKWNRREKQEWIRHLVQALRMLYKFWRTRWDVAQRNDQGVVLRSQIPTLVFPEEERFVIPLDDIETEEEEEEDCDCANGCSSRCVCHCHS